MHVRRRLPVGRVALLFTDIQGSTALLHALGAVYGEVLDLHDQILRGLWDEFGGVEFGNDGDAFCVAFADHAQAIEAATTAQRRLASTDWPGGVEVRVRMGLHSGEPLIRGDDYWGVDVHYAARVGAAAHGGQVLLSADMRDQVPRAEVELLGTHGLKDFPAARRLFHLIVDGSTAAHFPPPRTMAAARSNLPTIDTAIIGREQVIADLGSRLTGSGHLVTLLGPGGVGKTRTAVAVAESLTTRFPDGTAFVTMASLHTAAEVPEAIAEAIDEDLQGVEATTALAAHLRERRLLLILDNAEHLTGLADVMAPLVRSSAGTRWLVTSQAPLGMRAETVVRLGSLEDDAAVALFLDRAQSRQPGFVVAAEEQELLRRLCRDLDGMPLAIELAASRAPTLGLRRLAQVLGDDPDAALGQGPGDLPDRQRGLRAALDWTVSLLTEPEREAYASCGAFAEAWSIEDLELMLDGRAEPVQVWDALTRLLDLSLVVQRGDGRFTMPERVRRHAIRYLDARDNARDLRRLHADLVLATVKRLVQRERHLRFRTAMAELEDFLPEVQQAFVWAAEADPDTYRMLLGSCGWAWVWFDRFKPSWRDDLVAFARAEDPGNLAQGCVWALASTRASDGPDLAERRTWLDAAMDRFVDLDSRPWVCEMFLTRFELEVEAGDVGVGLEALEHGRKYARSHALVGYERLFEDTLAVGMISAGDYEGALKRVRRWLDEPGSCNYARAGVATFLGDCAFGLGAYREAVGWYAEDLRGLPRSEITNALMQVASLAASCAALALDQVALELASAVNHVAEAHRGLSQLYGIGGMADQMTAAGLRLPPSEVEAARARGRELDYDALIERALEIGADVAREVGPPASPASGVPAPRIT